MGSNGNRLGIRRRSLVLYGPVGSDDDRLGI
ncbi:MAG: hypothetical protein U0M58_09395 [Blautia sp.]|nr:hypothetical protein [Blautia sp.]